MGLGNKGLFSSKRADIVLGSTRDDIAALGYRERAKKERNMRRDQEEISLISQSCSAPVRWWITSEKLLDKLLLSLVWYLATVSPPTVLPPSASPSLAPPSDLLPKTNWNVHLPLKMTSIWESGTAAKEQGIHSGREMRPFQRASQITTLLWQLVSFYTDQVGWFYSMCVLESPSRASSFIYQVCIEYHHIPGTGSLRRSQKKAILLTSRTSCAGKPTLQNVIALIW